MNIEDDEQIGCAIALVLAVVALDLAWLGRNQLAHLADELGRALVEADDRALWVGRFCIEIEHILHAGDIFGIHLWNAPPVLAPRLEVVLSQPAAHGIAREAVVLGEPDHFSAQQIQGPTGAAFRRA
jgi:hypothetical protein